MKTIESPCPFVSPRAGIACQLEAGHDEWHLAWDGNNNSTLKMWSREGDTREDD